MSEDFRVTYKVRQTYEITFETKEEMEEWLLNRSITDMTYDYEDGEWSDGQTNYSEGRQQGQFLVWLKNFLGERLARKLIETRKKTYRDSQENLQRLARKRIRIIFHDVHFIHRFVTFDTISFVTF